MVKQQNKITYTPKRLQKLYRWQEDNLRIGKVPNLERYQDRKRRFLTSPAGRKFLSYRKTKFLTLHGLDIWFVDGNAIRRGLRAGDVDFTMGGHAYRYLYIPKNEIWIDKLYAKTPDLEPLIWHEYLERKLMEDGTDYEKAHTIASDLEITLREGTHFILPVGTYRQTAGFCGPAALKIVLDYYQRTLTEKEIARLCQTTSSGTNPKNIVAAARTLDLHAYQKEDMTAAEVKKIIRAGTPVIANFQLNPKKGEGHYAVLMGYSRNTFILSDPQDERGYREVKIGDFMKMWYELEDQTVRQGIVVRTLQP